MILAGAYDALRRQIFQQEISGTYKRRSIPFSYRVLRTLGTVNLVMGIAAIATYFATHAVAVSYGVSGIYPISLRRGTYNIYIEISELYQNNLHYSKSISYDQLAGATRDLNLADTVPYDQRDGITVYPAGLVADSFFQDTMTIPGLTVETDDISWDANRKMIGETSYTPGEIVPPESWSPATNQGTEPLNTVMGSGLPILNERFANWMDMASFAHFRKLWGRVHVEEAGDYELHLDSIYDLSDKKIFITQRSWLGYRNYTLAAGLVGIGLMALAMPAILDRIQAT